MLFVTINRFTNRGDSLESGKDVKPRRGQRSLRTTDITLHDLRDCLHESSSTVVGGTIVLQLSILCTMCCNSSTFAVLSIQRRGSTIWLPSSQSLEGERAAKSRTVPTFRFSKNLRRLAGLAVDGARAQLDEVDLETSLFVIARGD